MAVNDWDGNSPSHLSARQYERGGVAITASIREHGGGRQQVEILDLSRAGFRMRTGSFIPEDRVIFLTLPGFSPLEASIAWHKDDRYGCKFVQRLHEAIYDHIVDHISALRA